MLNDLQNEEFVPDRYPQCGPFLAHVNTSSPRGIGASDQNPLLIKISVTVQIELIEVDETIDHREV